jgi:hypothetical protein
MDGGVEVVVRVSSSENEVSFGASPEPLAYSPAMGKTRRQD